MKRLSLVLLAVVLLGGCYRQQHRPRLIVILLDTSGSIEPDAEAQCMDAISKLVQKIDRGDRVSIIPITGDAEVQSTGRVLRFEKPPHRTAYDADLIQFSRQVQQSLQEFRARVIAKPTSKTDIFGGIRMAAEEFAAAPAYDGNLIIFSDFIEDDGQVDFKIDRRLRTKEAANQYAIQTYKSSSEGRFMRKTYLGLLQSRDLQGLDRPRREAIREFWVEYFKTSGGN